MTAPTLVGDADEPCYVCLRNTAMAIYDGRCGECYARATWTINLTTQRGEGG